MYVKFIFVFGHAKKQLLTYYIQMMYELHLLTYYI